MRVEPHRMKSPPNPPTHPPCHSHLNDQPGQVFKYARRHVRSTSYKNLRASSSLLRCYSSTTTVDISREKDTITTTTTTVWKVSFRCCGGVLLLLLLPSVLLLLPEWSTLQKRKMKSSSLPLGILTSLLVLRQLVAKRSDAEHISSNFKQRQEIPKVRAE